MSRIKKLEEKFNELEKKYDELKETASAYKWLIDHPTGVAYNTTVDFIPSPNLSIDYILNVDYFDNRYNKVVSVTPIRSHSEIEVKTITFDRLNGNLKIVLVKYQGKNSTYYEYKRDMYQIGSTCKLRIDFNGTGDWKDLPIIPSNSSCVVIM